MSLRIRRGGDVSAPPEPPGAFYGPTQGRAAVIAGAGPLTVSNPGGGLSFNSSTSLQAGINANGAGTTFVCTVNNPVWNTSVNTGTKAPTIIFPGPVGQKIIDGAGADIIPMSAGNNTTIKGGTWQNFGTTTFGHGFVTGDFVTIEDAVVTDMWNRGIDIQGTDNTLRRLRLHANGVQGLGTGAPACDRILMENCEVYGNNTRLNNPGDQGGAFKFLFSGNSICRNNYVHDNIGFGMWWDTQNYDWLIENNVSEDNVFAGFFYEGNYGSVIRNNLISNNGKNQTVGGLAPQITASSQVRFADSPAELTNPGGVITPAQFSRNIVDYTDVNPNPNIFGGLILLWDHTDGPVRHVGNHDIFENQFWLRGTAAGRILNIDQDQFAPITTNFQLWNLDNHYFSNEYRVASTSTLYWSWDTGTGFGVNKTYAQWQAFHPGDNLARIQI